jgi:hypothetical protein
MILRKSSMLLFVVFCLIGIATPLQAAQVQLSWTAPTTNKNGTPLTDLAGCKLYYGPVGGTYGPAIDVGNTITYTITGLTAGQEYVSVVRAYDTSQNQSDPSNHVQFKAPSGLVAAYSFNEGSNNTVNDASGKGNHGTISGATRTNSGRYGKALTFDGVNDWVTVPDSASLDLTNGMTLEARVYPTSATGWRTVLLKERTGHLTYALYANSDTNQPLA